MARIRTIKPEFFTSLSIADLSPLTRLTFIGLWTHVDDAGRCIDDARLIKAAVSPLERTVAAIEADLVALTNQGRVIRYEGDGKRLIQVANWTEHQYINRPRPSKFPDAEGVNAHGGISERSRTAHARKGKERKGTGKGKEPEVADKSADAVNDRPDVARLCAHLADRIESNGSKRPAVTAKWRDSARLLLDKDGRTEAQVVWLIDWCQADEFWHSNILSMPKLREKFDQLLLKARPSQQPVGRVGQHMALVRQLAEQEAANPPLPQIGPAR
jgi:hypothetical protein